MGEVVDAILDGQDQWDPPGLILARCRDTSVKEKGLVEIDSRARVPRALITIRLVAACLLGAIVFSTIAAGKRPLQPASEVSGLDVRPRNATCIAPQRPPQTSAVILQTAVRTGFTPTAVVQLPTQASNWHMVSREGYINRYQRTGKSFVFAARFADLRDRVLTAFNGVPYGEMGLLGLAFHPQFATNGFVFVYYSALGTQGTPVEARLSRFVSRDGGLTLDNASEEVLLRVPRTTQYHWGGTLAFGPDGMLYAAFGDGFVMARAQTLDNTFGKMIRINVDKAPGYQVPPNNPFVSTPGALPEIYALGFRNPWKWSFDRATNNLWLGDVGANAWEEVDLVVKGGNFGWPVREGAHCGPGVTNCSAAGLIDPVVDYPHDPSAPGAVVIGGYVYAGTSIPSLTGTYLYADGYGKIFALRFDTAGKPVPELLVESGPVISTFAQDETGEVYLATAGNVYLLAPAGVVPPSTFPTQLSQTGCMSPTNPSLPGPGLIPYDVNSPLWSDGATKERWIAIPDGSTIARKSDGDWDLPVGSVAVKTFRINGRLVETRLMIRHDDGDWAGYSYEWNDAQTDAFLLPSGKVKAVEGRQWTFPSRNQCLGCHTEAAGRTLGLETAQLNRRLLYPSTQRLANQLSTLGHIGMFGVPLNADPSDLAMLAEPSNTSRPLELRARSYLHANCSMCHRPNGSGQGPEDFRYSVPTTSIGAINVIPTQSTFGIPDARLIVPGKPDKSIVSYRIGALDLGRMPPLATAMVDTAGLALVNQWIRSGLGMGSGDQDNDGFADNVDNCKNTVNPTQLDTDGDGFGNMCDADFNNDRLVNSLDLATLRAAFASKVGFATYNRNVDMNGDGFVNALDLALFRARFGKQVGDQ